MKKFILLVGVDDDLFKACFGKDEDWSPYQLQSVSDECSDSELTSYLLKPGLCCAVIDSMEIRHWKTLKDFVEGGGFLVYFGIMGVFNDPSTISSELGVQWTFSGYTTHEFILTSVAKHYLGDAIIDQQYTKSNLISAPDGDRMIIPKVLSLHECLEEWDIDRDDYNNQKDYDDAVAKARNVEYPKYCERLYNQSPLVMNRNNNGGRIAYIGFVNGDGNIPKIVRALLCGKQTTK